MLSCKPYIPAEHQKFVSELFKEAFPGYSSVELEKCIIAANEGRIHCPMLYDSGNNPVGFVFMKDYGVFNFVFYFAVSPHCAGHTYTMTFLEKLFQRDPRQLIWEAERPVTDIGRHRIAYLKRCGLVLNSYDYKTLMPDMVPPGVQFYLMSRTPLSQEEYSEIIRITSEDVDF